MNSELSDFIEDLRSLCNRADVYAKGTLTTDQLRSLCDLWSITPAPIYRATFNNIVVNNQYAQRIIVGIPYKSLTTTLVSSL